MADLLPGTSLHFMVKNPPIDRLAALVAYMQPFVDEVVIVDTGTNLDDRKRMESWNRQGDSALDVLIIDEPFVDFATTRNKGLERHRFEWTLVLDPDELPSPRMVNHIVTATSEHGSEVAPLAKGYCYWTLNWWDGVLGPFMDYHWHTRLFKTKGSYFFRPVHELVAIDGQNELDIRGTYSLPFVDSNSYLIHSKGGSDIKNADELYEKLGEVSR